LVLLAFGCIMVYSVKKAAALYRSEQGECYFGQWVEKHMVGLLMGAIGCASCWWRGFFCCGGCFHSSFSCRGTCCRRTLSWISPFTRNSWRRFPLCPRRPTGAIWGAIFCGRFSLSWRGFPWIFWRRGCAGRKPANKKEIPSCFDPKGI